ncbi:MAG: TonB-dependent receptor [Acidobacteriota bacterium]
MIKRSLTLVSLALFFGGTLLFPQEQEQKTEQSAEHHEVVVTATRLETPAREVASSLTVISAADLERQKKISLFEALKEALGVSLIQNGGPGEAASAFLRGANSEHTLILLDGVELNDSINPSRSADLAHLFLGNLERLEILRGPQSPLYGSDAIGGVINIISKRGRGKPRWTLTSSGGSYGTFSGQAGLSGSTETADYSFGLVRFFTRGISAANSSYLGNSEKDAYENWTFSGRLGVSLRKNLEVNLVSQAVWAATDIDNFGGPYGDDPNNSQDYRSLFLRGEFRGLFLNNRWEQKLSVALVDSRRRHQNLPDEIHPGEAESGLFKGRRWTLDWQNNFFFHATNTLTAGLAYEREEGESEYDYRSPWLDSRSLFPRRQAETVGLYLQDSLRFNDRFFATAGFRFDRHSRTGDVLTYRLAPAYIFHRTQTKLKASLGTGFKSPSLYQLYAPPTLFGPIGNRNLKPEQSLGWDAGIEQPLFDGRARVAVTFFHNDFENLIDFSMSRGYINIGKAESEGGEVEFGARPIEPLSVSIAYTYLKARDRDSGSALLRRPRHLFSARLNHSFGDRWTLAVSFDYTGRREDLNYSAWPVQSITLFPYQLLSGVISYEISRNVQVFSRLDNILDETYEMVYGYGTLGFSAQFGLKVDL